jgi:hypothetical protein
MAIGEKYTLDQVREIFKKEFDLNLISKKYINCKTKLKFICKNGHQLLRSVDYLNKRIGRSVCNYCLGINRNYTINDVYAFVKKKNGKCLSINFSNKEKLIFECGRGHQWNALWHSINSGKWCPVCAVSFRDKKYKRKYLFEDICKLAKDNGGRCISSSSDFSSTKYSVLKFQCSLGHIWEAKAASIVAKHWCHECNFGKKISIEEIKKIAIQKEGKCLSEQLLKNKDRLLFICKNNHQWLANANRIKHGSWCAICAKRTRIGIDVVKEKAKARGGDCISEVYVSNKSLLNSYVD